MKKTSKYLHNLTCVATQNTSGMYLIEPRFGYNVYLWDTDFIHLIRYALSSGCITQMSAQQLELLELLIVNMTNGVEYSVTDALSDTLYRITSCMPLTEGVDCGYSLDHTYVECTN